MKSHLYCGVIVCILAITSVSCGSSKTVELWNGRDFTGWTFVLVDDSVDPADVWSVQNGVIHCKGVPNGYMRTEAEYSDYTLTLEWRWAAEAGNSGVLLHAQEPFQVWPQCIECQLHSGNAGDFILIGPGSITVDGETHTNTEKFLAIPNKEDGIEKPLGEWNNYRIICKGGEITCYVNDVLMNHGIGASQTSGVICLQSEGAPIEFRNIRLEKLD